MRYFIECTCTDTPSHVTALESPCQVGPPFPHIFAPSIGFDGFTSPEPRPEDTGTRYFSRFQPIPFCSLHFYYVHVFSRVKSIDLRCFKLFKVTFMKVVRKSTTK
jgi:hypothetical protein